jgi:hypothetical protein
MDRYLCTWERPDSPTRGLSDADMRAYHKAHSVRADCTFALRDGALDRLPGYLVAAWAELAKACDEAGRETPAHRERRDAIRTAVRCYLGGYAYALPTTQPVDAPAKRKPARMTICPNCGHSHKVWRAA